MLHKARVTEDGGDVTPRGPAVLLSSEAREQLPQKEPEFKHTEWHLRNSEKRRRGVSPGNVP